MSQPGWYPDPGGAPNQYRYWDGHGWSAETVGAAERPAPGPGRSRRGTILFLSLGIVVVLVVAVVALRTLLFADRPITDPGPLPTSTVTGGDDRSPTAETSPSPTPSPEASTPPIPSPANPADCTQGDPTSRVDHPRDGRIHGGGLSFPELSKKEWQANQMGGMTWAYDVGAVTQFPTKNWFSLLAVGALNVADGFEAPQPAAELVLQCTMSSAYYRTVNVTSVKRLWSRAITVDGHQAWSIRSEVRIDDPVADADGDVLDIIVVEAQQHQSLAMFVGAAPIGYADRIAIMDQTISDLTVD